MVSLDYPQLQKLYGGCYIAWRGDDVIAQAATYDELSDNLDNLGVKWETLVIEYIEPVSSIRVY